MRKKSDSPISLEEFNTWTRNFIFNQGVFHIDEIFNYVVDDCLKKVKDDNVNAILKLYADSKQSQHIHDEDKLHNTEDRGSLTISYTPIYEDEFDEVKEDTENDELFLNPKDMDQYNLTETNVNNPENTYAISNADSTTDLETEEKVFSAPLMESDDKPESKLAIMDKPGGLTSFDSLASISLNDDRSIDVQSIVVADDKKDLYYDDDFDDVDNTL